MVGAPPAAQASSRGEGFGGSDEAPRKATPSTTFGRLVAITAGASLAVDDGRLEAQRDRYAVRLASAPFDAPVQNGVDAASIEAMLGRPIGDRLPALREPQLELAGSDSWTHVASPNNGWTQPMLSNPLQIGNKIRRSFE